MVVTGTRADYGLLRHIIREIDESSTLELCLVVTGSHLSEELGMTIKEIEVDNFAISHRISILDKVEAASSITNATAKMIQRTGEVLIEEKPDLLLVLGDRYESFAATTAATLLNVAIGHVHGGELTLGAVDDALRHSMTKMAWWHFTTAEEYRQRVIKLGEDPERVFNVGSPMLDSMSEKYLTKEELEASLDLELISPVLLVTLHPETRTPGKAASHAQALWAGIRASKPGTVVITKANADAEGTVLNKELLRLWESEPIGNSKIFDSLGHRRYLSLLKLADVAVGNSSSLVIEAPMVGTASVNIGRRQEGRVRSPSIRDVDFIASEISSAIQSSLEVKNSRLTHPFGKPGVAKRIVRILNENQLPDDLVKGFYE